MIYTKLIRDTIDIYNKFYLQFRGNKEIFHFNFNLERTRVLLVRQIVSYSTCYNRLPFILSPLLAR